MNKIAYMISRSGHFLGNKTAVVSGSHRLTFSEVNFRSNQLARALAKVGLNKNDRVGILLPNCPEFIETDFALIKGGFVRVPINPRLTPSEYTYMLNNAEANTLVFGCEYAEDIKNIRESLTSVENFIQVGPGDMNFASNYEKIIGAEKTSDFSIDVSDDDPYQILYTSGTTGKPKGAVTSFRSRLSTIATVLIDEMKVKPSDSLLSVAPLAHGGGTKILPHFIRGARNVLLQKFSLEAFCKTVEHEKITTTWMVPTMITMLLDFPDLKNYDLSSLKTIVYAAAPMPEATLRRALKTFGNIFVQVYGLSEAPNPDLFLPKEDHLLEGTEEQVRRLQSAGKEAYGVCVRVIDKKGNDIAPGDVGEIIIAGDNIMTEYWKLPEVTAETIRDGWLYTGDMATIDDEGYFFIVDRRKDLIISGGFNVYPREIEEVLYGHPAVLEAAVIGVPDDLWGESVKAVISCRPGMQVTEKELITFCEKSLSGYKKPKSYTFQKELPKSPNGKILKRELREKYWEAYGRKVN